MGKMDKRIVSCKSILRMRPVQTGFVPKASHAGSVVIARLKDNKNIKQGKK